MPELPEVETIKRDLGKMVRGLTIPSVLVKDSRVLAGISPEDLHRAVTGCRIMEIRRRGKAIIMVLSGQHYLMIQPKMTGQLICGPVDPKSKVVFNLSDGNYLNYNDQRLFGKISVLKDLDDSKFLRSLGPEPLEHVFEVRDLKQRLSRRRVPIKPLLLNQNFIAGIGNIYASEILFRAGIGPKRRACSLRSNEIIALIDKTREVLCEAITWRGTSMDTYVDVNGRSGNFKKRIRVYGRENEPCPACRLPIKKIVQGQRSTFYCRHCQK